MSIWNGDASDFYALANDLSQVGAKAVKPLRGVMDEVGKATADEWRDNARITAGAHGKHYPDAISHELTLGMSSIGVEVGPDSGKKQGGMGMGFEFGSINQPPHLDGLRAVETMGPRAERMIDSALGYLFE